MDELMQRALEGMRLNGFEVVETRTGEEAKNYLLSAIGADQSVGVGGSVSVRDIGLLPALEEKGCSVYQHWGVAPDVATEMIEKARKADVYLCSANAVTSTGKLVLIDGRGNRVGAVCEGPKHLYFVISHSKVVDGGVNTAIGRIKKTACPQNCRRLGIDTLCAREGRCAGTACDRSICNLTLVVDRVPGGRKVTVVFVEEALGY